MPSSSREPDSDNSQDTEASSFLLLSMSLSGIKSTILLLLATVASEHIYGVGIFKSVSNRLTYWLYNLTEIGI
jgi:hypothetical protein